MPHRILRSSVHRSRAMLRRLLRTLPPAGAAGSLAVLLLMTSCAAQWTGRAWSGKVGIAEGVTFASDPVCTVAWDLAYTAPGSLSLLQVDVKIPAGVAGAAHAGEWAPATYPVGSAGSLEAAAAHKHLGGSVGVLCPNKNEVLNQLRGTQVRITWRDDAGRSETETLTIDTIVSGTMRPRADPAEGYPRVEWTFP